MFQLWTRRCPKHREQASYHDTNKPAENISDTEIRSEHLQQAEVLINGTDVPEADEKKKRKKKTFQLCCLSAVLSRKRNVFAPFSSTLLVFQEVLNFQRLIYSKAFIGAR